MTMASATGSAASVPLVDCASCRQQRQSISIPRCKCLHWNQLKRQHTCRESFPLNLHSFSVCSFRVGRNGIVARRSTVFAIRSIASLACASPPTCRLHRVHVCHAATLLLYEPHRIRLAIAQFLLLSHWIQRAGLHCQFVACGELQHAAQHADGVQHWLAVELSRNQLYCFACRDVIYDAEFVSVLLRPPFVSSSHSAP